MTSQITITGPLVSFDGPDATRLYAAMALRAAIKLHKACGIIPTRGMTISKLFAAAKPYTGQSYKRGEHDRAMADLTTWIETMRSALPIVRE